MYILSHPLRGNYGGLIQAYSLQLVLFKLGKTVSVFDYDDGSKQNLESVAVRWIRSILHFLCLKVYYKKAYARISESFKILFRQVIRSSLSKLVLSVGLKDEVWIVGSDQVWRTSYIRPYGAVKLFFLSFLSSSARKASISYAASFGGSEWEGTQEETEDCRRLLREFKAVSVREHSGVKICKEVFGVDAVQMPDPTLLLHSEDYGKVIDSEKTWLPDCRYIASYVLDETKGKGDMLQGSARVLEMSLQHLTPHSDAENRRDRFPISVPQWLRLIRDCEYFITDSFHGCVFAIIYNKPFVCLGNEGRGNARFDTLLGTFGLEDRLITNATPEKVLQVLNTPVDWKRVNSIHDAERERGINFLKENLT